jgi:hypothetical protein
MKMQHRDRIKIQEGKNKIKENGKKMRESRDGSREKYNLRDKKICRL